MDRPIARRTVMAGAGAGVVSLVANAHAETKPDIRASEFSANKGSVKLYLYRKRVAPKAGETQPPRFSELSLSRRTPRKSFAPG